MYVNFTALRCTLPSCVRIKLWRIMKLSFFLVFAFCLQASAVTLAQRVTLSKTNATLAATLEDIRKQSGMSLLCDAELINEANRVTLNLKNVTVDQALQKTLAGQPFSYQINNKTIVIFSKNKPAAEKKQPIKITGKVTDNNNQPIAGATVRIKNTQQAVATDFNGVYNIDVPDENAVLVFTFVGFSPQEIPVSNRTTINVRMTEVNSKLNEIVVIGYGTTTRANITTSVAKVDPQKVPQAANSNVTDLLFGRAAGVQASQTSSQPGGAVSISVRGRNGSPLYVVDGVVYPSNSLDPANGSIAGETNGVNRGGLGNLNPDDIESIEILKDASAAIYGVNAANGVVLITTKKGKKGGMNVSYDGSYSVVKNYPYLKPLNATQYETLFDEFTMDQYLATKGMQPFGSSAASGFTPKYSSAQIAAAGVGTNWLSQVLQTGSINNHNLTVNGGTDKTTYFFSGGFFDQDGTVKKSGMKKFTGRANLSFNLTKFLTLNTNFSGNTNQFANGSVGGQTGGSGTQGFSMLQAALGYPANVPLKDANGNNSQFALIPNPVALQEVTDNTYYHALDANISADFKIIPDHLTAHVLFGDHYEAANRNFFVPSDVFYFQQNLSRASVNYNNRENQTYEGTVSYKNDLTKWINLDAVAGMGQYRSYYNAFGSQGSGAPDAFTYTTLGAETGNLGISSNESRTTLRSYFARANFNLLNRYLIGASWRYDGYSFFFPQNKYASFPSVSVGWKINDEPFFKNVTAVDLLKIRASIGTTGQTIAGGAAYGYYASDGNIIYFNNGATDYATIIKQQNDNPNLHWQKTINKNIGLDFGFLKGRINGSFDVFRDDLTELLAYAPTAPLSIFPSAPVNGGHQIRTGYEFSLNTDNVHAKNFDWSTVINVSHYFYRWQTQFPFTALQSYQSATDPVDEWYFFKTNGLLQIGQAVPASQPAGAKLPGDPIYVDKNGDGKITAADIYKLNPDPKISAGFGNTFRYNQFDLTVFFYGQFGGTATNYNYVWGDPTGIASQNQSGTIQALDVWTPNNTTGTRPGVNYIENSLGLPVGTNINYQSTNFVRCRNITLGYSFNSAGINKFAKSLRIFADVQNAFIVTKFKGGDPEVYYSGYSKGGYAPYPMARTFSFGVRAGF